jgi:cystathionine beta-lyase
MRLLLYSLKLILKLNEHRARDQVLMPTDFDAEIDRKPTESTKFNKYKGSDILPLWVADMDFRSPPAVIDALQHRVQHGIFGYTEASNELKEVLVRRMKTFYNWEIQLEDLVFFPGVVEGLNLCCAGILEEGEAAVTATPVYHPFFAAPENQGRELKRFPMNYEGGGWQFPMDALHEASEGNSRLLMLCNPFNPIGKALTRLELEAIVDISEQNDLIICSDEIHCDLMLDGREHIPIASISEAAAARTITLMAPSKTFNLAGLGGSFAIIQNPVLREQFQAPRAGLVGNVNLLGYTAMQAAYASCEDWRQDLLRYLEGNRDYLATAIESMPGISMSPQESTYLAWLNVAELGLNDPPGYFEQKGLGMSPGEQFGDNRFMRLNFGCPRAQLEHAVARLEAAISGAKH